MMNESITARWHPLFDPTNFRGSLLLGLAGGSIAGLIAGVAARLMMRGVALISGIPTEFTIEGSLFIVILGAVLGAGLGVVFGFFLPYLPGTVRWKGFLSGLFLALMVSIPFLVIEPQGELALAPKGPTALLLASVPLLYGFVLGLVASWLAPIKGDLADESRGFAHTAGLLTIIGALVGVVAEIILALTHPAVRNLGFRPTTLLAQLGGGSLVFISIAGIAGLMRSGASGKGILVRVGLGLALLTFTLLGVIAIFGEMDSIGLHGLVRLVEGLRFNEELILLVILLAAAITGLLLGGIAVLRTGRWGGWRRYSPLLVGLFPISAFLVLHPSFLPSIVYLPLEIRNVLAFWLGALYALCWLALGIAMRVETGQASDDVLEPPEVTSPKPDETLVKAGLSIQEDLS